MPAQGRFCLCAPLPLLPQENYNAFITDSAVHGCLNRFLGDAVNLWPLQNVAHSPAVFLSSWGVFSLNGSTKDEMKSVKQIEKLCFWSKLKKHNEILNKTEC
jgi:hypothetical protein